MGRARMVRSGGVLVIVATWACSGVDAGGDLQGLSSSDAGRSLGSAADGSFGPPAPSKDGAAEVSIPAAPSEASTETGSGAMTPPDSGEGREGGEGGEGGSSGGPGSGSSGGSGGSGPVSICDGAGTRALSAQSGLVDDFEGAAISPGWFAFNDVMPIPNVFKLTQVLGGAAGTEHSGHYAGVGARVTTAGGFGVGAVYNVAINPAARVYCVDISAFDGLSLWAKAGAAGSTISLNFIIPQTNKASTDGMGRPNGGDCLSGCFNHPRVALKLTTQWVQYVVKFSDATGGSAPLANVLQELAWLSPDSNWDFSLDEIAFYKGTAPHGPVGH
jgi:hypothetical protein